MSTYLLIGNVALFIGTILSILVVISDRRRLNGQSPLGALTICVGVSFFEFYYILEVGEFISAGLNVLTITYWLFVTVFSFRRAIHSFRT